MAEWCENAITKVELTEEQYKALVDRVVENGEGRKAHIDGVVSWKGNRKITRKFQEDDFLCGAMACMNALGIGAPSWIFQIMANIPVCRTPLEKVKYAEPEELPLLMGKVTGEANDLLVKRLKEMK